MGCACFELDLLEARLVHNFNHIKSWEGRRRIIEGNARRDANCAIHEPVLGTKRDRPGATATHGIRNLAWRGFVDNPVDEPLECIDICVWSSAVIARCVFAVGGVVPVIAPR